MIEGVQYQIDIVDTAGHDDFKAIRDQYIREGDGFMLIYSITYITSFREISKIYSTLLRLKDLDPSARIPVVLVG